MFSYDEALSRSTDYFNGDELAGRVFVDKYALRDSLGNILEDSPEKMHRRLAKEFARVEVNKFKNPLSEEEIFNLFDRFKYAIPQGSVLYGCGNNYQTISLSNCFVLESPVDSYGGILKTDEHLVQISKRRGGVGLDLSKLRPKGAPTRNSSRTSTGIVAFSERYSNSIREVGQDGRRGALMLSISVHHPNVLTFAKMKEDLTKVTGANISIRLSNEFLQAVEDKTVYELRFPVDSPNPAFSKMVDANEYWNEFIHMAWKTAEPGLLFWDNITSYNAIDCYSEHGFDTTGTNPCQPGWATVLTPEGISTMGNIKEGDLIWSESGWTRVLKKWSTGLKDVYTYRTTFGSFSGTENHRILQNNKKIEVKDAESIDMLRGDDVEFEFWAPQIVMDGLVMGDGTVHKASGNLICLVVGEDDKDYFSSEITDLILKHRPGINKRYYEVETNVSVEELPLTYERKIPNRYFYGTPITVGSFLRGLYSANGSVVDGRVTLKAASFDIINQVQIMLSSLGISSYYTTNKPSRVKFDNGEYLCRQSYDLNITRDRKKFYNLIGFVQKYKNEKLLKFINNMGESLKTETSKNIKIVEFVSNEEVFDITVDNASHTYWSGGLNVSNCAELPLCAFDSCRLLVQNLFSYVVNPFTKDAYFDWTLFANHVQICQRLMDDLIDLELEKIDQIISKIVNDPETYDIKQTELLLWEKIRDKCFNGRRTGLGITGMGDMLAALGIKYDSQRAIDTVEVIHRQIKLSSFESSVDMAEELGAFPIWDWEIEKNSPFLLKIKNESLRLYEKIAKFGRRNIGNLTIAPTGSISILSQTTSGIEPLFMLNPYTRRKKINPSDKNSKVDFVDQNGDCWSEFSVYHEKVKMWMEITGERDLTKSPWFGCTANDINWENRVKLQAAAQRHIDHAISSTLNLPENVTEEEVSKIYRAAWKEGLKGVTVYRNNCRTGVLVEKKETAALNFVKRPKELPTDVYHVVVKGIPHTVLVSLVGEKPYEVLVIPQKIKHSISKGKVIKHKKGCYDLVDEKGTLVFEDIAGACEDEQGNLTRFISMSLRHNIPIDYIFDQLSKSSGDINGFAKSVARCLKRYIKDETKTNERCPDCNAELRYVDGCKSCTCGWSKCG